VAARLGVGSRLCSGLIFTQKEKRQASATLQPNAEHLQNKKIHFGF
jgi:hypothetical protein